MTTLRKLLNLQRELMTRKLTPEVGIYRVWLRELVEAELRRIRVLDDRRQ